ncbi:ECF transporter S component [Clostridium sp. YIM B02515]|uniref:ECF transporter S component n=1 Tax=Clostridium rhizosphaerae TaxID=2803861 RepID=A0ABS1T7C5_9CLOT|nr:ECF transporter S component [Clostridium rhizosphaerae]MBL4935248.1 ECF transporter S component [Clostridium rhizosphaerae]
MKDVKKLTYTALLTAWVILIPIYFKGLQVQLPPFTATITAHVPIFIAMLLGPEAAVMVALGSALGFFISAPIVVAARALMHVVVALAGAYAIKKGMSFNKTLIITAPIHAILEALIVIPFGYTMYKVLIVVGIGTLLHHGVDAVISSVLVKSISKATRKDLVKELSAK